MKPLATTSDLLKAGVSLHQTGRLNEAAEKYRDVLNRDSRNPDALNLLGVIAQAQGDRDRALTYFKRTIAAAPRMATAHYNLANLLADLGHPNEAILEYNAAIAIKADYADACLNLGALFYRAGEFARAAAVFRDMTSRFPGDVRSHRSLALCFHQLKDSASAEIALKDVLRLDPSDADSHLKLANIFATKNRLNEAVAIIKSAIKLNPHNGEYHSSLGTWLSGLNDVEGAIIAHRRACELKPDRAEFWFNFGTSCYEGSLNVLAVDFLRKAIELDPQFVPARINLAEALKELGHFDDAIDVLDCALALDRNNYVAISNKAALISNDGVTAEGAGAIDAIISQYDAALAIQPETPETKQNMAAIKTNKALTLLAVGRYREGWPLYRYRDGLKSSRALRRPFPYPEWRGDSLGDDKLLLWTDQGVGDEILYSSMLMDLSAQHQSCILECAPRLVPLLSRSFPRMCVVPRHTPPVPEIFAFRPDHQICVTDLGIFLRPTAESFPAHGGFLKADENRVSELRRSYERIAGGRRIVGLSWHSQSDPGTFKSLALSEWGPILRVPGVFFVSLQYGAVRDELAAVAAELGIIVYDDSARVDPLIDLDGFAAQVAAMDLVISTSNTTVHFAGGLNVPVWTIVANGKGSLWYFRTGSTTPLYPSMNLLRQQKPGDWAAPIEIAGVKLQKWATSGSLEADNH